MKIIDRDTGKRLDGKAELKDYKRSAAEEDPILRTVEKDSDIEESSPMDPPGAYDKTAESEKVSYEEMSKGLKVLMEEHKVAIVQLELFEKALLEFKSNGYAMTKEFNAVLSEFFEFFDDNILEHNRKEEKYLFHVLHERLIESGESSKEEVPKTAVDIMEDDHVKAIQLAGLTFNLLGLAVRLPDRDSAMLTFDVAYNSGVELIEMLKLHIFREDNILFPLAQKLLSEQELQKLDSELVIDAK